MAIFLCALPLSRAAIAQQTDPLARPAGSAIVASLEDPTSTSLSESSSVQPELPDAPQASDSQPPAHQDGQTKRILGIIPNFRAVSADVKLPPQSVKEKFITSIQDSFDYSAVLLPATVAAYSQIRNSTPEFHQGAAGYGRYFWHTYVDQASENIFVEAIVPSITHQDNRYYTLGKGGFVKRTEYSLSRVLITRNDAGNNVFNSSEIIGAGAAAGISNLYYPSRERTFGSTADKWGQSVGIDAATFMFKEFWPDINRRFFHTTN
jgi:hypothetical protein